MSYAHYLKLKELLELQKPMSPSGDIRNENLFIITHQTYELWFKQIIFEVQHSIDLVQMENFTKLIDVLERINIIVKSIINQINIIFTLKSHDFNFFRKNLGNASGLQSYQFIGIESLLGKDNIEKINLLKNDNELQSKVMSIIKPISLWESIKNVIMKDEIYSGECILQKRIKIILEGNSCLSLILNKLLDLDSLMQEWRYHHMRLVERTIGKKIGTAGTSGFDYLRSTVSKKIFHEIWESINSFE